MILKMCPPELEETDVMHYRTKIRMDGQMAHPTTKSFLEEDWKETEGYCRHFS